MRKARRAVLAGLLGVVVGGSGSPPARGAAADPLLGILKSELRRNLDALKTESVAPYFASYTVHDTRTTRILTSFGALQRTDEMRSRAASIDLRVGDYTLDNTHPMRGGPGGPPRGASRIPLPLAGDEAATRAALWRATDRAFKQAAQALTRVRTNVAAKVREENPAPDFSREDPAVHVGEPASHALDVSLWEQRLRRLSAPFAEDPRVFLGSATLEVQSATRYFVNSEASEIVTGETTARLFLHAMTKADDGMELPLYASYFARTPDGLPPEGQLLADAREMAALLARLRTAPIVDPYSGPAVLSGRAAGVFFHEIFGHRVEGHRQKNVDDAQTFAKRVDQAVLPPFLSVVFDPTRQKLGSQDLVGHYVYDDEGVKARRVVVVDRGVLKTFLLSRAPLAAFPRSNGHGRAQAGLFPVSRQSNLFVESAAQVPHATLLEMLRDEARKQGKAFGLLFENIEGGFTFTGRTMPNAFNVLPNVVFRVYTDGRPPELVRGVDLIGTPLAAFGKIVAASDQVGVFNGMCGAESGSVPVSAAAPALLVSEVEVQKKAQSQETLPILPAPVKK
jgi:predicted Zn-dependent protease